MPDGPDYADRMDALRRRKQAVLDTLWQLWRLRDAAQNEREPKPIQRKINQRKSI